MLTGGHEMNPMITLEDTRFSHLVIGVTDMDRALSFYRGLLGIRGRTRSPSNSG